MEHESFSLFDNITDDTTSTEIESEHNEISEQESDDMAEKGKLYSLFAELGDSEQKKLEAERTLDSHILLVDGLNTFMRVWSTYPSITDNGEHVGGLVGFIRSIGAAIRDVKPTRCVLVFDGKDGNARRRKIYPDYKAKRKQKFRVNRNATITMDMDDESKSMQRQFSRLFDFLDLLPVTSMCIDRCEADDVIGYIAHEVNAPKGNHSTIMSTDKDYIQLVSSEIDIYNPTKKRLFRQDTILNEYGIHPSNFLLYRAIDGDASDNIRGIYGCGEKKVKKYLTELTQPDVMTLDDLFELCDKRQSESAFYRTFLKESNQDIMKRNCKLMQLSSTHMNARAQTNVNGMLEEPINRLNKFEFIKLLQEDRMWSCFGEVDSWFTHTWQSLNNFALSQ